MNNFKKKIVREKIEKKTFDSISNNDFIMNTANRFVHWVENHRIGMFIITIVFLLLMVGTVYLQRSTYKKSIASPPQYIRKVEIVNDNLLPNGTTKFNQILILKNLQQELEILSQKKEYTKEDSLKMKEIYEKLITIEK